MHSLFRELQAIVKLIIIIPLFFLFYILQCLKNTLHLKIFEYDLITYI
jgi:lipoprotein signal peptidase